MKEGLLEKLGIREQVSEALCDALKDQAQDLGKEYAKQVAASIARSTSVAPELFAIIGGSSESCRWGIGRTPDQYSLKGGGRYKVPH